MPKSARQLNADIAAFLGQRPARGLTRPASAPASERFVFRAVGSEGDPWPAWLHAFKSSCGVYAIKERGKVVYVGSSKKRLYDTVTRHFQQWKRKKNWWKGRYGAGHDPGLTYNRAQCEVAVRTVPCGSELTEEAALIERFKPRDNLVEHPDGFEDLEEAPF